MLISFQGKELELNLPSDGKKIKYPQAGVKQKKKTGNVGADNPEILG
jgi:hypothetical protein